MTPSSRCCAASRGQCATAWSVNAASMLATTTRAPPASTLCSSATRLLAHSGEAQSSCAAKSSPHQARSFATTSAQSATNGTTNKKNPGSPLWRTSAATTAGTRVLPPPALKTKPRGLGEVRTCWMARIWLGVARAPAPSAWATTAFTRCSKVLLSSHWPSSSTSTSNLLADVASRRSTEPNKALRTWHCIAPYSSSHVTTEPPPWPMGECDRYVSHAVCREWHANAAPAPTMSILLSCFLRPSTADSKAATWSGFALPTKAICSLARSSMSALRFSRKCLIGGAVAATAVCLVNTSAMIPELDTTTLFMSMTAANLVSCLSTAWPLSSLDKYTVDSSSGANRLYRSASAIALPICATVWLDTVACATAPSPSVRAVRATSCALSTDASGAPRPCPSSTSSESATFLDERMVLLGRPTSANSPQRAGELLARVHQILRLAHHHRAEPELHGALAAAVHAQVHVGLAQLAAAPSQLRHVRATCGVPRPDVLVVARSCG